MVSQWCPNGVSMVSNAASMPPVWSPVETSAKTNHQPQDVFRLWELVAQINFSRFFFVPGQKIQMTNGHFGIFTSPTHGSPETIFKKTQSLEAECVHRVVNFFTQIISVQLNLPKEKARQSRQVFDI